MNPPETAPSVTASNRRGELIVYWVLTAMWVVWCAAIIIAADNKLAESAFAKVRQLPYGDKFSHLILAGVFSLLLNLALDVAHWRIGRVRIFWGVVVLLVLATLEELSNQLFPSRSFDPIDWVFNMVAVLLGGWAASVIQRRRVAAVLLRRQRLGEIERSKDPAADRGDIG